MVNLPDFVRTSYETLLSLLRTDISQEVRERLTAELRSRDRAEYNLYVREFGGEFK